MTFFLVVLKFLRRRRRVADSGSPEAYTKYVKELNLFMRNGLLDQAMEGYSFFEFKIKVKELYFAEEYAKKHKLTLEILPDAPQVIKIPQMDFSSLFFGLDKIETSINVTELRTKREEVTVRLKF